MTMEEAIKEIKRWTGILMNAGSQCVRETAEAQEMAIAALEKQIPKKPVQGEPYTWIDSVKVRGRYKDVRKTSYGHACPNCGSSVARLRGEYCQDCGQRLDWSENPKE